MNGIRLGADWEELPTMGKPRGPIPPPPYVKVVEETGDERYFVPVSDVPPLPTAPYTVIEPLWKPGRGPSTPKVIRFAMTLHEDGHWRGLGWFRDAATLRTEITGWSLLASPAFTGGDWEKAVEAAKQVRRDTARDVLERVRQIEQAFVSDTRALKPIYEEFGVEQP
jgi:hypothetical protein